jgi:cytochrome c-type biogenesis protein
MRGTTAPGGAAVAVAAPAGVQRQAVLASLAFIFGFTIVFVALGASASAIGQFFMSRLTLLGRIAGAVVIIFGLHTMGVLRIEWLYQEKRVQTSQKRPEGFIGAALVGMAFAFGWTPCLGPILAGILAVAATQDTVGHGVRLLSAYSIGLGVPFFAAALAINRFFAAFAKIRHHYRKVELVSGGLLVAIGVLIFTNRFTVIAQWLTPYLPVY